MKESEAAALAVMSQPQARKKLLEYLGIELNFGYDEGLRSTIETNMLHDTFTHAVLKGFSWRDVCKSVHLCQQLLQQLVGKPILEAANIYQNAALNSGIDNRNLAVYTDYFFSTFMQHYKLYQYVFQNKRDLKVYTTSVAVEAPIPPEELRCAKPPHLHEYDQHIKQIQAQQREAKEIEPLTDVHVNVDESVISCPQTEAVEKIISKVIQEIGKPMLENISEAISTTYDNLNVKLEETALARPKQLGAPPRYQLKAPLPMPKATMPKLAAAPVQKGSAKGERKKSGKK